MPIVRPSEGVPGVDFDSKALRGKHGSFRV